MGGAEQARPASREAYELSVATGAEYVEFDIRRTGDDALVVYHDAWAGTEHGVLPDGAAAPGATAPARLSQLSYAQLCGAAGYQVPLVCDVLAILAGRARGHLDLKETGYEDEVIKLAIDLLGPDGFVATTLEDESVAAIKRAFPEVTTALSLGRDLRAAPRSRWLGVRASELFPLSRVRACGADWVAVHHRLARLGVTAACHRVGIGVLVWTADTDRLIDQLVTDERIDVLVTNRPRHAVARRAELVRRPG
jgi:glycerophosphoryl diester phosphodiesterase